VRLAVYNAHWETLGGGEQLASGLAVALARDHDVELLVDEAFDPVVASERLGIDVTPFRQRVVAPGTRPFLEATAEYDVLINSSFSSTRASRARRSLYYVHFPMPHAELAPWKALLLTARPDPLDGWIEREHGFWLREFPGNGCWTSGRATAALVIPRGVHASFSLRLHAGAWTAGPPPHARVVVDERPVFDGTVDPRRATTVRADVRGRGVDDPIPVTVTSDTFVPRVRSGNEDDRELGVVVSHMSLGPRVPGLRRGELARLRDVRRWQFVPEFLDCYEQIASNSPYTATWVERLWGRTSTVLPPPVRLREPGPKRRVILSVGRFFANSSGHSKKQVELIEAFRVACDRGLRGWELHLVGGCKPVDRAYAETARKAAVGLPVRFHINARGGDVAELFASAQLFWHAAGLGEDLARHPDRQEHFGITVVEAMSAGAVPLVHAHGGPATIVRDAACGRTYETPEQLAAATLALVRRPDEIERLSQLAVRASGAYAFDQFAERARALIDHDPSSSGVARARAEPGGRP
jgi:glycosyltransferase involved in cell wall biosynthesis